MKQEYPRQNIWGKYGKYYNIISAFKLISVLEKEQNKSFDY